MSRTSTASSSPPDRGRPTGGADAVGPEAVAATLAALGIAPSRRLGQSVLVDPFVADAEAALVGTAGPVLEVGGGLGILTRALLRRGVGPLTVVERDPRLADHLARTVGSAVRVVEGDARTVDLAGYAAAVGNLPFSVATPILLRWLAARLPRWVALVQREVADRLAAGPGSRTYGRLSILTALYGTLEPFQVVPSEAFHPPPAVAGRLVAFTAREGALPVPSVPALERAVATLFAARRKQLGNLLPRLVPRDEAAAVARQSGWPDDWARRRPEELAPEAFFGLARALAGRRAGAGRP